MSAKRADSRKPPIHCGGFDEKFAFAILRAVCVPDRVHPALLQRLRRRIRRKNDDTDVAEALAPMADVFDEIMTLYVDEPDVLMTSSKAPCIGMMNQLDEHSSYVSRRSVRPNPRRYGRRI